MPKNTGIKNRAEYIQRILKEDKGLRKKDEAYDSYLDSLKELMDATNDIYKADGEMTKDSYEDLLRKYMNVVSSGNSYKTDSESKVRLNIVNHIHKIISRDIKALNNLDKEHPGNIDAAFEAARAIKVEVSQEFTYSVGGSMSDRFPMKNRNGKRGFFTARTITANDEKWNEVVQSVEKIGLSDEVVEKFRQLRTNHQMRKQLGSDIFYPSNKSEGKILADIAVTLGLYESPRAAENALMFEDDEKLEDALKIVMAGADKLSGPYNLQERLGYDPYTRIDNRNAAMYEVAKLIGCKDLIAKAVPMVVVNGNHVLKGTFMENADGSDVLNLKGDDPLWKFDVSKGAYDKRLYRDLADLQVLDYICGNIDRHKGNMFYKTEKAKDGTVKITGLVGIDNDGSFPEKDFPEWELECREGFYPRIYMPENFRFVNRQTKDFVESITRPQLETVLRGHNLPQKAIDLAWQRTLRVKKAFQNMKNLSYVDELEDKVYDSMDDKNNPFCNDDDMKKKPSIFTGFNEQVDAMIDSQIKREIRMQNRRTGRTSDRLNLTELKKFKDEKQREKEEKVATFSKAGREKALFAETQKIEEMNALMKRANLLKSPTKEFRKMRDAMAALHEHAKAVSGKVKADEPLEEQDFTVYEERLKALNEATKFYLKKKGLTPRSDNGKLRWDAATRIQNRAEELMNDYEVDIKFDGAQNELDEKEDSYELE